MLPDDVDLEGAGDVAGPAPTAPALESTRFELDLSTDDAPASTSRLPAALQPPEPVDPIQERLTRAEQRAEQAERQAQRAEGAVAPYLAAMYQQATQGQQAQDPRALEQKLLNGEPTTADLVHYVRGLLGSGLTQQSQLMELTARRTTSENYARGLFHGEGYEGRDFDQIRTKHVQPVLERLPYLRDVFTALNPEQPALIEYGFGVLMALADQSKADPGVFYRQLWQLLDGRGDDQGAKIQSAARSAAHRVAPSSATGRPRAVRTLVAGKKEIEDMSDRDFERLERQVTGGNF